MLADATAARPPNIRRSPVTGARLLVDQLRLHGVDRIFCVPGESFLAVLDALLEVPEIHVVTCRHEGGAAMMADAYGKLTGRPGIVFVTRGPGATNASAGIHVAHQDSTPVILFIGQIERSMVGRDAFQEVDYGQMFRPLAKWVSQIDDGGRIQELVGRAFHTATAGRPGPVVLAVPEDVLLEEVEPVPVRPWSAVEAGPTADALAAIADRLARASRPLLVVGGGGWCPETARRAARFASAWDLPVSATFRCQDFVDNGLSTFVGSLGFSAGPGLIEAVRESDLILLVGARLGEVSSNGYTLIRIPCPEQDLIHIHPDPEEIGRVYQPTLGVNAGPRTTFRLLDELSPPSLRPWAGRTARLRQIFLDWTSPGRIEGPMQMGDVMLWLREQLPVDTIVTNGAGNFAIWPNRYHRYRQYRTMLAPVSGSMGYGVPAAVAAKIQHPDRLVVAFAGDGDFLMAGQELATSAREKASIIVLLLNNGMYGTIRMHQERAYPERTSATDLVNPDFVALARAYGAHGEKVTRTAEFAPAFARALAAGRSALIEIVLDPDVISPTETVTSLRRSARTSLMSRAAE